jgi:hypothetical protein
MQQAPPRKNAAAFRIGAGLFTVKSILIVLLCGAAAIAPLVAAPQVDSRQEADQDWSPVLHRAAFAAGTGPQVLVDAAHGNFHTLDGRFKAFGDLLTSDGYRVAAAESVVTDELLAGTSIFVISNAVFGGADAEWVLPTPSAFTPAEIVSIVGWVRDGGSLLLIADHMPFPGATAKLADSFGVIFYNGYAKKSLNEGGTLSFTRSLGQLANHAVTNGRSDEESVDSVRSFTGQAFRFVGNVQPLMSMPDDWHVFLPVEAGEFDETTPVISARGLVQGAVLHFGRGRVAVFGEAAMFTAQTWVRDGVTGQMGMNHPSAAENPQFIVNVMHWLSGLLDD